MATSRSGGFVGAEKVTFSIIHPSYGQATLACAQRRCVHMDAPIEPLGKHNVKTDIASSSARNPRARNYLL